MRKLAPYIAACVLLFGCQKENHNKTLITDALAVTSKNAKKKADCELINSLTITLNEKTESDEVISEFRKEFDSKNEKVSRVLAGLYSQGLQDSILLKVQYKGKTVYFFDESRLTDTILIATFDTKNRLQMMAVGNAEERHGAYGTTAFVYDDNRLIEYHGIDFDEEGNSRIGSITKITYDAIGNVISMYDDQNPGRGVFFTYDYSVKPNRQWYTQHFLFLDNTVYLAQFMGWLPDLEPVNKRIHFKVVASGSDPETGDPGYVFADEDITGHVFDANGNLIGFKRDNGVINPSFIWSCDNKR
jgi:hypothetical protein